MSSGRPGCWLFADAAKGEERRSSLLSGAAQRRQQAVEIRGLGWKEDLRGGTT